MTRLGEEIKMVRMLAVLVFCLALGVVFLANKTGSVASKAASWNTGRLTQAYSSPNIRLLRANGTVNKVFAPGETIYVQYVNAKNPAEVQLFWANLFEPYPDWSATQKMNWVKIDNFRYYPELKMWKGSFVAPTKKAELMIITNVKQDAAVNKWCSGNPIFSPFPESSANTAGIFVGTGYSTDNPVQCAGEQSLAAVDDYYSTSWDDMAEFWQLTPGNYWRYKGVNLSYPDVKTFKARIEMEQPVSLCGLANAMPMRFTKDSPYGYWGPLYSFTAEGDKHWVGELSRRWLLTGFLPQTQWNGEHFMGSLGGKSVNFPEQEEGKYDPELNFKELGLVFNARNNMFFHTEWQHYYFAPYMISPRYVNPSSGYIFERNDFTISPIYYGAMDDNYCEKIQTILKTWKPSVDDNPTFAKDHGWYFDIKALNSVPTPDGAVTGPAYRYRWVEYGIAKDSSGKIFWPWVHREDWYVAKNKGIVRLDGYRYSGKTGSIAPKNMDECKKNPYCLGRDFLDAYKSGGQYLPTVIMWQTDNFVKDEIPTTKGQLTNLSVSADNKTFAQSTVVTKVPNQPNYWYIKSDTKYTGNVEACPLDSKEDSTCNSIVRDWGWMDNGLIKKDMAAPAGKTYYAKFRPQISKTDSSYEKLSETDYNAPWSRVEWVTVK